MPAKKRYDAVATVGEYTDSSGQTKKRYITVGAVFESDDGRMSLKIEAVPVGGNWNGWINFFDPKQREAAPEKPKPAGNASGFRDMVDDTPF